MCLFLDITHHSFLGNGLESKVEGGDDTGYLIFQPNVTRYLATFCPMLPVTL